MGHVAECTDHPGCIVIESDGWPDTAGSWRSHFDDDVDPAARLNPDGPPEFADRRSGRSGNIKPRKPTAAEQARFDGETRRPDGN